MFEILLGAAEKPIVMLIKPMETVGEASAGENYHGEVALFKHERASNSREDGARKPNNHNRIQ